MKLKKFTIMIDREKLLNKYYKGDTDLNEESALKKLYEKDEMDSAEKDLFNYYAVMGSTPEKLEADLYEAVFDDPKKTPVRYLAVKIASAAAAVIIAISIFFGTRSMKTIEMNKEFALMEQALLEVSESLQPDEAQDDMLVLWVDNDVEIIIN